jgi:hypothetical protein
MAWKVQHTRPACILCRAWSRTRAKKNIRGTRKLLYRGAYQGGRVKRRCFEFDIPHLWLRLRRAAYDVNQFSLIRASHLWRWLQLDKRLQAEAPAMKARYSKKYYIVSSSFRAVGAATQGSKQSIVLKNHNFECYAGCLPKDS